MTTYQIFTDGGSRGNPGMASCAFVVYDSQNKLIFQNGVSLGITTNNVGNILQSNAVGGWTRIQASFKLDSLLVVQQLKGNFKIKDAKLKVILEKILLIIRQRN